MQHEASTQRETFLQVRDLLTDLASQCRTAQRSLASGNSRDSDYLHELALWSAAREGRIADALAELAGRGPVNLVGRRLQFEPPHARWTRPADTLEALAQLLSMNQTVADAIATLSSQAAPIDAEEKLDDVAQQIDAVNRKLSLALVSAEDIQPLPSRVEDDSQ